MRVLWWGFPKLGPPQGDSGGLGGAREYASVNRFSGVAVVLETTL
jgi:hypothetical protein